MTIEERIAEVYHLWTIGVLDEHERNEAIRSIYLRSMNRPDNTFPSPERNWT